MQSKNRSKSPSSEFTAKPLNLRESRTFSKVFKEQIVSDLNHKRTTIREVCAQYQTTPQSVYRWLNTYSPHHQGRTRMVVELESESKQSEKLRKQVADLERIIGQKQVQLDYFSQLIDIASAHYGEDLKKNFGTKLSNGSEPIAKRGTIQ